MRFNVAAGALLLQALPSSSSINEDNGKAAATTVTNELKGKLGPLASNQKNYHYGGGIQRRKMMMTSRLKEKKKTHITEGTKLLVNENDELRHEKISMNNKASSTANVVECDPNTPDQGVLACGMNNYCIESRYSSLGGICAARKPIAASSGGRSTINNDNLSDRDLQEGSCPVGTFFSEGECETCPCGDPIDTCYFIGIPSFEGVAECVENCNYINPVVEDCQVYKGDGCYFGAVNGTGINSCEYYYDFGPCSAYVYQSITYLDYEPLVGELSVNISQPYPQSATITYMTGPPRSCGIVFNGVECNSCELNDPYSNCYDFDCSNVPGGTAGNDCDVNIVPALDYCYLPEECNICGIDGGYLQFPNATFPVATGGVYACSDLYYAGLEGTLGSQDSPYCAYFSNGAGPTCCGTPVEGCNICGEDGSLYNYNSTITVPGFGSYTCYEIYSLGVLGNFGPPGPVCETIRLAVSSTCCAPEICYVCPDDGDVSRPETIVPGTGDPPLTCAQIQEYGRQGLIPPADCLAAQAGIPLICGCGGSPPTEVPASSAPSDTPGTETAPPDSIAPSDAPGAESDSPVAPPTDETDPPDSSAPSNAPGIDATVEPTEPPATDPPQVTPTQPPIAPTAPPATDPPGSSSNKVATFPWISLSLVSLAIYMSVA